MHLYSSKKRERDWMKMFAIAFGNYYRDCGCPHGMSYQVRGDLSLLSTSLSTKELVPVPIALGEVTDNNQVFFHNLFR